MYPYLTWSSTPLPLLLFVHVLLLLAQVHVSLGTPVALDPRTSSALSEHSPVDLIHSTLLNEAVSHDRQSATFSIPSGRTTDVRSAKSEARINSPSIDINTHHQVITQFGVRADNARKRATTAAETKLSVLVVGVVAVALSCHYWDLL
ncbi:hypothetical protein C8Q74DRAFT_954723 [Fomes fomentarius]|nr:hypothetical protein C8Q74DRAFT_954723 [Fomes fomentarius]